MNVKKLFGVLAVVFLNLGAHAEVRVLATLPEWGALVQEIGGSLVSVTVATTALQDPHRIQARPSLIAAARRADLVLSTGAGLEVGWLPAVLDAAGNSKVRAGQSGYLEAASLISLKEVPLHVDRAMGDVHPEGNPHLQLDPDNILKVANALAVRLKAVDGVHGAEYDKRLVDFSKRWQAAMAQWRQKAAPLRGVKVVAQHQDFAYLYGWTGLEQVATLEPLPGVPPTAAHLASLVTQMKAQSVKLILIAAYQNPAQAQWLQEKTGAPLVVLPFTVGGDAQAKDLFALFDDTLQRLLTR